MPWCHFSLELNKLPLSVCAMFSVFHLDGYAGWFYFLVTMNHEPCNLFLFECRNRSQLLNESSAVGRTDLMDPVQEDLRREKRLKEHIYYEGSQVRQWGNMVTVHCDTDVIVTPQWREPSWKICKSKTDRSWFLVYIRWKMTKNMNKYWWNFSFCGKKRLREWGVIPFAFEQVIVHEKYLCEPEET